MIKQKRGFNPFYGEKFGFAMFIIEYFSRIKFFDKSEKRIKS